MLEIENSKHRFIIAEANWFAKYYWTKTVK